MIQFLAVGVLALWTARTTLVECASSFYLVNPSNAYTWSKYENFCEAHFYSSYVTHIFLERFLKVVNVRNLRPVTRPATCSNALVSVM